MSAAAAAMGRKVPAVYTPAPASADVYDVLYAEYIRLHNYFGRDANDVLHRLRALRDRVLGEHPSPSPAHAGAALDGEPTVTFARLPGWQPRSSS